VAKLVLWSEAVDLGAKILFALAHEEKCVDIAPRRAKDRESGAEGTLSQARGTLTPIVRGQSAGYMQEFPPEFPNNLILDRPRLERGHEVSYVWADLRNFSARSEDIVELLF
jgi:hypothetical protein